MIKSDQDEDDHDDEDDEIDGEDDLVQVLKLRVRQGLAVRYESYNLYIVGAPFTCLSFGPKLVIRP